MPFSAGGLSAAASLKIKRQHVWNSSQIHNTLPGFGGALRFCRRVQDWWPCLNWRKSGFPSILQIIPTLRKKLSENHSDEFLLLQAAWKKKERLIKWFRVKLETSPQIGLLVDCAGFNDIFVPLRGNVSTKSCKTCGFLKSMLLMHHHADQTCVIREKTTSKTHALSFPFDRKKSSAWICCTSQRHSEFPQGFFWSCGWFYFTTQSCVPPRQCRKLEKATSVVHLITTSHSSWK